MPSGMRRLIAVFLSGALVVLSPGFPCYQAFAASAQSARAARPLPARPVVPGASMRSFAPLPPLSPAGGLTAESRQPAGLPAGSVYAVQPAAAAPVAASPAASLIGRVAEAAREAGEALAQPGLGAASVHEVGRRLEGSDPRRLPALAEPAVAGAYAAAGAPALAPAAPLGGRQTRAPPARPAPARASGRGWSLARSFRVAALVAALTFGSALGLQAQDAPGPNAPPAAAAQADSTRAGERQRQVAAAPVELRVEIGRQGATVGERVEARLIVGNPTGEPVVVSGLRSAFDQSFGADIEIASGPGDEAVTLAPGETRVFVFELIPFDSGRLELSGPVLVVVEKNGAPARLEADLPAAHLEVATVLTPDWKQKGFRDIKGPERREAGRWAWLASLPLLLLMILFGERLLSVRRERRALAPEQRSLLQATRERLAALEGRAESAPAAEFYGELYDALASFAVDFNGLPRRERNASALIEDLARSRKLSSGQAKVLRDLARRAQELAYNPHRAARASDPRQRRADLGILRALVGDMAGEAPAGASRASGFSATGGEFSFANPWALALFIPLVLYYAWKIVLAPKGPAHAVADGRSAPARKSLRQRVVWLPQAARAVLLSALVLAAAHPQFGYERPVTYTRSTDMVVVMDRSGSMSLQFGNGVDRMEAAKQAYRAYVDEQRRGSTNRVGLVTFDDKVALESRASVDYDALIAAVKEVRTGGSTAVGDGIMRAVAHFLELNVSELNDPNDPRVREIHKILRDEGVAAALAFAKQHPDLLDKVVRADREKVIILLTDGDSNAGINPIEAAHIAHKLGVRIYPIGIASKNAGPVVFGMDENVLRAIAAISGTRYFRADDAQNMREIMLEISRLEKSPSIVIGVPAVKHYQSWLYLLALLAFLMEVGLASTRLRVLYGAVLLTMPLAGPAPAPLPVQERPAAVRQAESAGARAFALKEVPADVAEANLLFYRGDFDAALTRYAQALERYPDMPELHFNMGNAYLKLFETRRDPADLERAMASYKRFLAATQDPAALSRALYNLGNAALMKQDARQALDYYKDALRRDPSNQDAKWNLEVLKKLMEEQQGDPSAQQEQNKQDKKKQQGQQQKGQKGDQKQQGDQKGDQQGEQEGDQDGDGDQQGDQRGDRQGNRPADPKSDKSGVDHFSEQYGQGERSEREAQRRAIPRSGTDAWGFAGFIGAGASPWLAAGTGLTFGMPWVLYLLPIVVGLVSLFVLVGIKKRLADARKLSPQTAPASFSGWWGKGRALFKGATAVVASALLTIAAADPKLGLVDSKINFGDKDVIVAADASASTLYAEDKRREITERELRAFLDALRGTDRVGLVVFSGSARTAAHLSTDYGNFIFKLERLESEARALSSGSSLKAAIAQAVKTYESAKDIGPRGRVLIVISDGEIFAEDLKESIALARAEGIKVYAIGVGSPEGSRMVVPTPDGSGTQFIIDNRTGQPARTHLVEETLRRLAEETGGLYHRAGEGSASMSKLLTRIAADNKGESRSVIRSPQSVALWFAWPALLLLLLDLLLPHKSALRREKKPEPAKRPARGAGGAFGLVGLLALPLDQWPVLGLLAGLSAAVLAVILIDAATGRRLVRGISWGWQRRARAVEKGLARDAAKLFDLRASDREPLERFLASWTAAASQPARARLIQAASSDAQLWRQKLLLAYLAGPAESSGAALAALRAGALSHIEPVAPALLELLERGESFGWFGHVDAARRLSRLAAAFLDAQDPAGRAALERYAAFPDEEAAGPARRALGRKPEPAPRSWAARAGLGLGTVVLAGTLSLVGAAGYKTAVYHGESGRVAEAMLADYYGPDAFIFTDRYIDERIPAEVLPAFRRWYGGGDPREMERALEVVSRSADPRADNILDVALRHADRLELSPKAEATLFKALLARESESLWRVLEKGVAEAGRNARLEARMIRLMGLLAQSSRSEDFDNLFLFVKSPSPKLRQAAVDVIWTKLAAEPGSFYSRLGRSASRFSDDADLSLWSLHLAVRGLALPESDAQLREARQLVEKLLERGGPSREARLAALARAQGGRAQLATPYALVALNAIEKTRQAMGPQGEAARDMSRAAFNAVVRELVKEANGRFQNLEPRLRQARVIHQGGWPVYRDSYHLAQVKAFRELVAALAAETAAGRRASAEQAEYLDRALATLAFIERHGASVGMLADAESPGAKAAASVNAALDKIYSAFQNERFFIARLAAAGLAPRHGGTAAGQRWLESYTPEQVAALRGVLAELAAEGQGWSSDGSRRTLSWSEKRALAEAIDALDRLPGAKRDEAAFWDGLRRPGQEPLFYVRLGLAVDGADAAFRGRLLDAALERAARPGADGAEKDELIGFLRIAWLSAKKAGDGQAFAARLEAAAKGRPAAHPLGGAARDALYHMTIQTLDALAAQPGVNELLVEEGVRVVERWEDERGHGEGSYTTIVDRTEYAPAHYAKMLKAVDRASRELNASPAQAAALAKQKRMLRQLERMARSLEAPAPAPRTYHGMLALGAAALPAVGLAVALGALLLAGGWLAWRLWSRRSPPAPPAAPASLAGAERRMKQLELAARKLASSPLPGSFRSRLIGGDGLEFAESKPFRPGDDWRRIDWKASSRGDQLYSKKYALDKQMTLRVIVDVSRSGDAGSRAVSKSAVAREAAALLLLAAAELNVRYSLTLVSDRVELHLPVSGGRDNAREAAKRLLAFEPKSGRTDLRPALRLAAGESQSRAMIAVISDFIGPDARGELGALGAKHDLIPIRVLDPIEAEGLPDVGLVELVDAESGERRLYDSSAFRADSEAAAAEREAEVAAMLRAARARAISLSTDGAEDGMHLNTLVQRLSAEARRQDEVRP